MKFAIHLLMNQPVLVKALDLIVERCKTLNKKSTFL
ncbi:MAG: hypothetical protein JWR61_1674 [Ferruginibacter sp.]|nr:hypothetical protein [Ferruginibacter sp.]